MNKICVTIFSVLIFHPFINAQSILLEDVLMRRILQQQAIQNPLLLKGVIPSYVTRKPIMSTDKINNNIFYNDLLIYTLSNVRPDLSPSNQTRADIIIKEAVSPFTKFKNKNGRGTYNFWRTDSAYTFPYTWWIPILFKDFYPPDDLDDTALTLLAIEKDMSVVADIHRLMQQHTISKSNSKGVDKKYKSFPAYSTWFGKKYPGVVDVCVLSNILCMVQTKHLTWTKADSASLNLIVASIQNDDVNQQPLQVSPYYGKASIIFYHLARLMIIKNIPELEALKPQLKQMAEMSFVASDNLLERILLSIALMKWDFESPEMILPEADQIESLIELNNFPFFIGNVPSFLSNSQRKMLTKKKIGLFYHYCPAFNDVLFLEYLVLKRKTEK